MTKIYNLEEQIKKKINKALTGVTEKDVEILISVIQYVYMYIPTKVENPLTDITPRMSTEKLFEGNRYQFAKAFVSLVKHWNLDKLNDEEIPFDQEFERFETVEDLCTFIDKKLAN